MIRKHKKQLILSSLTILLPIIIGLFLWNDLPDQIITHWGADGTADGWSRKLFTIVGLPLIILVFHWICIFFTVRDPKNKEQSAKVFSMVLWIMPVISLLACCSIYWVALGQDMNIGMLIRLLIAFLFLLMGNYMPKCKQNHTIGLKIRWTLRNEENWYQTHRLAGKLWVMGGLFLIATLFVPLEYFPGVFFILLTLMVLVPILYSYIYYRKQLAAGTVTKEDFQATAGEKNSTKFAAIVIIGILMLVVCFTACGKFELIYNDSSFTIDATFWDDATINYADIETIEYCQIGNPGSRTFGYGSPFIIMGQCNSANWGSYTGYYYSSCDFWVVMQVKGKLLTINGKDEAGTRAIYEELLQRTNIK